MLVVQQALQVMSRKRSPHWLKPAHNAVKMQSFHKTGWATLTLDYIGSLIASTTRPAQLCFLHLELSGCKLNLWNGCAHQLPDLSVAPMSQKQPPTLACPTPPHRGEKPVSRTCSLNCSRETSTVCLCLCSGKLLPSMVLQHRGYFKEFPCASHQPGNPRCKYMHSTGSPTSLLM